MINRRIRRAGGFTLVELIIVILVIGILASLAAPKITELQQKALEAKADGIAGAVRSGIAAYAAESVLTGRKPVNPLLLDYSPNNSTCSPSNPFFTIVLSEGVTDGTWRVARISTTSIYGAWNGTRYVLYVYNPTDGRFVKLPPT